MPSKLTQILKLVLMVLVIAFSLQLLSKLLGNLEIMMGLLLVSFGILSIIWTILARYNLSPKSQLRMFANNFLACSLALLMFTIITIVNLYANVKGILYLQYILIFVIYFFFILVSYYLYTLGKQFGFQKESISMGKYLKKVKKIVPSQAVRTKKRTKK